MQQTIHGDCTKLAAFVSKHLSVYLIILFPGKLSAVFIVLIESVNKINFFLGHCFTFLSGKVGHYFTFFLGSIPFLWLSSPADRIKYSETPNYSEQYLRDQESGTRVTICNFSVFEAATNFSLITACSQASC